MIRLTNPQLIFNWAVESWNWPYIYIYLVLNQCTCILPVVNFKLYTQRTKYLIKTHKVQENMWCMNWFFPLHNRRCIVTSWVIIIMHTSWVAWSIHNTYNSIYYIYAGKNWRGKMLKTTFPFKNTTLSLVSTCSRISMKCNG